jgi:hypothetical protein
MKRLGQLGFLKVPFVAARPAAEDGRILDLFRNRAELKKSFSGAIEEVQRLKDRVKQQEGATARIRELLQELEARLAQPASAYPALVFYQLRDLWAQGRELLRQFSSELESQQLDRERKLYFAEFNRRQFAQRQAAENACLEAISAAAAARARVGELERQLAGLQRFWHFLARRRVSRLLHAANVQALLADQTQSEAHAARALIEGEQGTFTALSIEARRAINMATIAYAQALFERLERTGLLAHAQRAAAERTPPEADYGDRAACERLMSDIQRARLLLEQRKDLQNEIRQRAEGLRAVARYRQASDVLPIPESLSEADVRLASRVLVDDTWELSRTLLP